MFQLGRVIWANLRRVGEPNPLRETGIGIGGHKFMYFFCTHTHKHTMRERLCAIK